MIRKLAFINFAIDDLPARPRQRHLTDETRPHSLQLTGCKR